jgi:hypothetical protein
MAMADIARRLTVAICLTFGVFSVMCCYTYWRVGTQLETQLLTCLEGK